MTDDSPIEEPNEPPPVAEESQEAPYGWVTDAKTGQKRPRKRPGRRPKDVSPPGGKSPALEDLQALGSLPEASEDAPPAPPAKESRKFARMKAEPAPLPPFRAGVISKGINSLYRRAGRIIRIWDMEIGTAVVACTKAEDPDDLTVGEAWENLAKTNPRIRAFLLRVIEGGAMTQVFTAHLPILLAIVMKDGIRRRIPILKLADSFLQDDGDDGGPVPSDFSQAMGGISPDDMAQMMHFAQGMMGNIAEGMGRQNMNAPYRGPSDTHAPFEPGQG